METLPNWFWTLYYLVLLITVGAAIFYVVHRRLKGLSILAIVFALTIPVISIINSIGRTEGMDEFEYLVSQFQQGAIWTVFVIIGYLYLIVWWVLFLLKSKTIK